MTNNKRTPRPQGTTELGRLYHRTNMDHDLNNLKEHIMQSYITNNFRYCNEAMNMNEFTRLTGFKDEEVMNQLVTVGTTRGVKWEEYNRTEEGIGIIRELNFLCFKGILQSSADVSKQTELLLKSQGSSYKPWISSEVGKMLKMGMEQTQLLMNFMKQLSPQTSSASYIPISPSQDVTNTITIDDITIAFKEQGITPLVEDQDKLQAVHNRYNIDSLPEVNALLQLEYDPSKEGLTLHTLTDLPIKEELPKHINRRAKELNIDLESDQI